HLLVTVRSVLGIKCPVTDKAAKALHSTERTAGAVGETRGADSPAGCREVRRLPERLPAGRCGMSGQLHPEIVCHHDGYTCGVRYNDDTVCRGAVAREVAGDWVYFRCEKCGVERAGNVNRFDQRGQRQASLERAGLPPACFNKTFDGTPDNREARRIVREWRSEER